MRRYRIGELNDSFPPTIDGVAQAVKNYAERLHTHCDVTVITPEYKGIVDEYPFEVFRYQSVPLGDKIGYRAGNAFDPEALIRLRKRKFDLLHVHAPFASSVMASNINLHHKIPLVLTYHTKFEVDIEKRVTDPVLRKLAMEFLLQNVNAADEVWTVTEKCAESLRKIGYEGEYRVMENGTDFAFGQADAAAVAALREQYGVRDGEYVFLFVGRMMWYKNTRLILDSLQRVKKAGVPFRCFMVGSGFDAEDIEAYARELGLKDQVVFTGPIFDREKLRVYYSMADMFLFPSTYDTSGIVVKEAAACECPTLLVRDSCAAEGAVHDVSGFLAEENAESCAAVICHACEDRAHLKAVGEQAGRSLYLSWDTAVQRAYTRYEEIIQNWNT